MSGRHTECACYFLNGIAAKQLNQQPACAAPLKVDLVVKVDLVEKVDLVVKVDLKGASAEIE